MKTYRIWLPDSKRYPSRDSASWQLDFDIHVTHLTALDIATNSINLSSRLSLLR